MNIQATEFYQKCSWIPWIAWKKETSTQFEDHVVHFNFTDRTVIKEIGNQREEIAIIHEGHKGSTLAEFFGIIESDDYLIEKKKKDRLSAFLYGDIVIEVTLKHDGTKHTLESTQNIPSRLYIRDVFELRVDFEGKRTYNLKVEGNCSPSYQILTEILSCMLLHHNEIQIGGS